MKLLRMGDIGPQVQFLQLALKRAGTFAGKPTGVFGSQTQEALVAFQKSRGLKADGIAGAQTHRALEPYYLGYALRTIRPGDTLYRISVSYGSSISAIMTANPGLQAGNLRPGQKNKSAAEFPRKPNGHRLVQRNGEFCLPRPCRALSIYFFGRNWPQRYGQEYMASANGKGRGQSLL